MRKIFVIGLILLLAVGAMYLITWEDEDATYSFGHDLPAQIRQHTPDYVTIDRIPQGLVRAVVAVEDQRFFQHAGFDPVGIVRAVVQDLKEWEIREGGSTITQQLVKNLFLTHEKTLQRKCKELILAVKLEQLYTKEQILEMYLNVIYYGDGAYGIQSASRTYYRKNVWELSLDECATLAGLPQAPSAYNPKKHRELAEKRKEVVMERMNQLDLDWQLPHGFAAGGAACE